MNNDDRQSRNLCGDLQPGDVHLWLSFYDKIDGERLHASYRELLNSTEREQEKRFYFLLDQRRYLITRALVRTALSRYAKVEPSAWVFRANAYGRPEIANAGMEDGALSFNISHTKSLIVLGITRHSGLGVDVENTQLRRAPIDIADRYFAPAEVAALAAVPAAQRQERFFEYWTFKESYIKARGMGLSLPLDKFSFHYAREGAVAMNIDPVLADDADRWRFWQFRPKPDYVVAVCAERVGKHVPDVLVRQVVPLVAEVSLDPQFSRVSGSNS